MPSKGLRAVGLAAAAALAVGLGTLPAAAQQTPVKIGLFTPLSGASSVVGVDMLRGVQLALDRINAGYAVPMQNGTTVQVGPGLLGGPLQLIIEDDQSSPTEAVTAVRKLVDVDRVAIVLGEYSSGRTLPAGQFTNESGVPHISIGANAETLRNIGPFFFNAIGLSGLQGPSLVQMAMREVNARRIAVFVPNNPFGQGLDNATCAAVAAAGLTCVARIRYDEQKTDYRPELRQLQMTNADAVIFFAYGADATLILRQAFELGLDAAGKWFGAEMSNWTADVASIPQAAQGIRGIEHAVSGTLYETQYRAAYRARFGEEPLTAFGAFGYDAAMLAALAIRQAGSTNRTAIRDALPVVARTYQGITGNLTFDAQGMRVNQDYGYFIYRDGGLQPYTPRAATP